MHVIILLFENYETLDVFGPIEIFGRLTEHYSIHFHSLQGGIISNHHGIHLQTESLDFISEKPYILVIPGGRGVRNEIHLLNFVQSVQALAEKSKFVLTVCTGSALLATTNLLNGHRATSNKRAFDWVTSLNPNVHWIKQARWVVDGKFYTSSGVSAGMDMCLGFIADQHGEALAQQVANDIEYHWHRNKEEDSFANEESKFSSQH